MYMYGGRNYRRHNRRLFVIQAPVLAVDPIKGLVRAVSVFCVVLKALPVSSIFLAILALVLDATA